MKHSYFSASRVGLCSLALIIFAPSWISTLTRRIRENDQLQETVCPLWHCPSQLLSCIRDDQCVAMLDCLQDCQNDDSPRRKSTADQYAHLQFPNDPSLCEFHCLDAHMTTEIAKDFVDCAGTNKCVKKAKYSDVCAPIQQSQVLSLETIPVDILEGEWRRLYTNSWDDWPCQATNFSPPQTDHSEPEP